MSDDDWFIQTYESDSGDITDEILTWSKETGVDNLELLFIFKQSFLFTKGVARESDGSLACKKSALASFIAKARGTYRGLGLALKNKHDHNLSCLGSEELLKVIVEKQKGREKNRRENNEYVYSPKGIEEKRAATKGLNDVLALFGQKTMSNIPSLEESFLYAKGILEKHGYDYIEWRHQQKLDTVSVPGALTVLGIAMDVVRADKVRAVGCLFRAARAVNKYPTKKEIEYLKDTLIYFDPTEHPRMHKMTKATKRKMHEGPLYTTLRKELIQEFGVNYPTELPSDLFPFEIGSEINIYCKLVYGAALVVFLCLSGARISELISVRRDDLRRDASGDIWFTSGIDKTNHGLGTERAISGFVMEAYNALSALSLFPEDDPGLFDYHKLLTNNTKHNLSKGYMSRKRNYAKTDMRSDVDPEITSNALFDFFSFALQTLDDSFIDELSEATPHAFRHVFGEFSIRRFDGPVKEFLRNHYRHSIRSYMTGHYQGGKVKEEMDIEYYARGYLRELMGRELLAINEGSRELFGPIGKFIRSAVMDFKGMNPADLDAEFDEILEQFTGSVEPHEYALCVPRKETIESSACFDKETKKMKTKDAQWTVCGGCCHRLSIRSHSETIMRIGSSAKEMTRLLGDMGLTTITKLYKDTLTKAENALKDMGGGNV
jgi:integrase